MTEAEDRAHRKNDDKLEELYDELIGYPGKVGFLEFVRQDLRDSGNRQIDLSKRLENHLTQHEKDDDARNERSNDIFRALLNLAGKTVLAALGALMGLYVALNTFLHKGSP